MRCIPKGSFCVCHFPDPEIGAAVLFIKAEETKQQINRLNSEVWNFVFLYSGWGGKGLERPGTRRSGVRVEANMRSGG